MDCTGCRNMVKYKQLISGRNMYGNLL
ncbi:hypothetical protein D3Z51_08585 [Clostridiaceae bacterium]|nr:hypothetical protein [Clostridiaceae bacterium]RKI14777.1 hypothetical protein D7V81_07550 [bacterium 1XD21-70]